MCRSSAYADNMRGRDRYSSLASLATLSSVTASQMAGQLCALICASPRVCVCVFKQLSLSRILILATSSLGSLFKTVLKM